MSIGMEQSTYFVSAGEYSGDLIGAELVTELKRFAPGFRAFGVVGPAMTAAGVQPFLNINDFNVMGIVEVAQQLANLRMHEQRILSAVDRLKPKFAVLIDFPGLHFRVAEQLKLRGIVVFQYVAPKVWAWGKGRIARLRKDFDEIFGILPFETDFFQGHGVPFTYVGSPHVDRASRIVFVKRDLGVDENTPLIAMLPGSRMSEIARILPTLFRIKEAVERRLPEAIFVVPLAPNLKAEAVMDIARRQFPERTSVLSAGSPFGKKLKVKSVRGAEAIHGLHFLPGMSLEIMAAADAAVVASGTATLECALVGTPMVVVYAMNELSYAIAKGAVKLPYVSLVNLVAGRSVVKEFIQNIPVETVADEVTDLVLDKTRRLASKSDFLEIRAQLGGGAAATCAAAIVRTLTRLKGHAY